MSITENLADNYFIYLIWLPKTAYVTLNRNIGNGSVVAIIAELSLVSHFVVIPSAHYRRSVNSGCNYKFNFHSSRVQLCKSLTRQKSEAVMKKKERRREKIASIPSRRSWPTNALTDDNHQPPNTFMNKIWRTSCFYKMIFVVVKTCDNITYIYAA